MAEPVDAAREFVLQVDKAHTTRRLYAPHMVPYQEASERLLDKCRQAVGQEGLTLRVGPTDLFLGKVSLVNRPKREESFFFPLYRDGLREITFTPDLTAEELERFMAVLEAEEKRLLPATEDTVTYLWKQDLAGLTYTALDGIGDSEGEDGAEGGDDYKTLVADLAAKIQNPAPPELGQSYAFVLDADVKVAGTDLRYESTTVRRAFEDNPTVLHLSEGEAARIRAELGEDREGALLGRFIDILFVLLGAGGQAVSGSGLAPVFQKLLESCWSAHDHVGVCALLGRLGAAAEGLPDPASRASAQTVVQGFLTPERVKATVDLLQQGQLDPDAAETLWELAGPGALGQLGELWAALSEGAAKLAVQRHLRERLKLDPALLRPFLAADDVRRVRTGLALMDERLESFYAPELLGLARHADEALRLKAMAAAGKLRTPAAAEALWSALDTDPSRAVRLLAFRLIRHTAIPDLALRLRTLIQGAGFRERPAWEREKFVRLLGQVEGEGARELFESWVPTKRWFWQPADHEQAELAFRGLAACGPGGLDTLKEWVAKGGKPAEIARKVLEAPRRDADSTLPGVPAPPGVRKGPA